MNAPFQPVCRNQECNNPIEHPARYCMECLMLLESYMDELAKAPGTPSQAGEADPSGKAPNESGAKLDAGKTRPSLIFNSMPRALMEVARVGTYGCVKYTEDGWLHVDNGIKRYTDAMDRHRLYEFIEGPIDLSSQGDGVTILHAAQIAWNALARLELMLRPQE